jgi:putative ABC transport system substrate-binding protein
MGAVTLRRRQFFQSGAAVAGLGFLTGCGILPPQLQQRPRVARIGCLVPGTSTSSAASLDAFRQGLHEHGRVEGQDIALELRYADGREEPLPGLAAELVSTNVDVIITGGNVATRAAQQASATIPIVFATADDPVTDGLVASLARPGANTTGLALNAGEEGAKRVQLFKEAVPSLSRVAILWARTLEARFRETAAAARASGLDVLSLEVRTPDELDAVLEAAISGHADGLLALAAVLLMPLAPRVVGFAATHRLPLMAGSSSWRNPGALMFYGVNIAENWRSAASYVDKILKGAKPSDLPVQRPTKNDFVINLKTAQALGLIIPQSVLQQATELIQ